MPSLEDRLHIPRNVRREISTWRKVRPLYGKNAPIVPAADSNNRPSHGHVKITTYVNGTAVTREVSARSPRPKETQLSDIERPILHRLEDHMHMLSHVAEASKPDFVPGLDAIGKHQVFAEQFYLEFLSRSSTRHRPTSPAALEEKVDLSRLCNSSSYAYQCLRDPEIVKLLKGTINDRRLKVENSLPRQSGILKIFHKKYITHDLTVQ